MSRKKAAETPALPESFEGFAAAMEPPAPPAPAAEPVPMGGMVEKRWSGIPMWECPRCGGTTFDAAESKTHTCKQVRYEADKLAD